MRKTADCRMDWACDDGETGGYVYNNVCSYMSFPRKNRKIDNTSFLLPSFHSHANHNQFQLYLLQLLIDMNYTIF